METRLIDAYLAQLRARLRWRRDVDDVLDEAADHLFSRMEQHLRQGISRDEAQRRALEDFGRVDEVARSLSDNDAGALALPSVWTRAAGLVSIGAGLAWLAAVGAGLSGGHMDVFVRWTLPRYHLWVVTLTVALGATTLALAGVLLRIGRFNSVATGVTLAVGVVLTGLMPYLGWAVTVLTGALGLAVLLSVRGDGPGLGRVVRFVRWLAVWPVGGFALIYLDEVIGLGPVDDYGDHQLAWLLPFIACALGSAAALLVVGARLWAETPARVEVWSSGSAPT